MIDNDDLERAAGAVKSGPGGYQLDSEPGELVEQIKDYLENQLGYYDRYVEKKFMTALVNVRDKYVNGDGVPVPSPAPQIDRREALKWYRKHPDERKHYGKRGEDAYYKNLRFHRSKAKCLRVGYQLETKDITKLTLNWVEKRHVKNQTTNKEAKTKG